MGDLQASFSRCLPHLLLSLALLPREVGCQELGIQPGWTSGHKEFRVWYDLTLIMSYAFYVYLSFGLLYNPREREQLQGYLYLADEETEA